MTTRLDGAATRFLPFNRGDNGAAGNPPYSPSPQPLSHQGRGAFFPVTSGEREALSPLAPGGRGAGGEGGSLMATAPLICGKKSGRGIAGWRY
ncbi:hypothetical protein [Methyloglobulus sp.]|uniref:hypothetical protein n=1 Tax=Methyloglobulus sp. TaxID=2518622 RepID=UPI00398910DB